ncbi:hypothetical protein L7F22_034807 [Adiantum nelumboides]|nr:hypothetical protein [Adiantum nelumboides]
MDENLCCDVSYCGTENKDVQAWVVMSDDLLLELGIYDDEEKADFMYQSLGGDALLFYDKLLMHVQYSWQLMKVVLLKHYVKLEVPTMQSRCFHGTEEECIKSWIARVEKEMMHLDIVDDGAKADFASQGLSYDAFVFMHMLPDDWRHSWLALKFSLLMRYWRFAYRERLTMVDDASVKLFDGDDVSESGYCSDFESDDYSISLFSADESVDGTPCDGAFADGESSCDDPATFNSFRYMREIKTKCLDQAHSGNERDQVLDSFDRREGACKESDPIAIGCRAFDSDGDACQLTGSLPLAIDVDDCEQSDDASDAYAKYNVVFIDDQLLSHDEEASDRDWGFDLPVVEMDADMTSYVEKASERLRILKSERETDQACNHGMLNTLFLSEAAGAGSNKKESNGQQILDVSGSKVLPNEVDSAATLVDIDKKKVKIQHDQPAIKPPLGENLIPFSAENEQQPIVQYPEENGQQIGAQNGIIRHDQLAENELQQQGNAENQPPIDGVLILEDVNPLLVNVDH